MIRRRALVAVPIAFIALLAATAGRAADHVLSVIPDNTLGFAVVNRLASTDETIQGLARQMQFPVPSLLGTMKTRVGVEKGLDAQGNAALVVMPGEDDDSMPAAILFVPVSDFGEFVEQLGAEDASAKLVEVKVVEAPFLVANDGGYAAFVEPKHRDVLQKALDEPNRIAAELAPLKSWLDENAIGLVVTRSGVRLLSVKGQEALQQAKEAFAEVPEEMKQQMEAAIAVFGIYELILQGIGEEIATYAAGVRVDEQGDVHITERTGMTPDGRFAKVLGEIKPPEGDLLAGLPGGPFVAAGAGVLPEDVMEMLIDFSIEFMKAAPKLYGLSGDQADQFAEISRDSMKGVRGMAMMLGTGTGDDRIFDTVAAVMKVDDARAYLKQYEAQIEAMNKIVAGTESRVFTQMEIKQIKVGNTPALELKMKMPKTPAADQMPGYSEMMEAMFGPGGKITIYLAVADEHTIVTAYTSKDALQRCLEAVKAPKTGLAGDAGVAETAAMLMPDALWVGYWSPKGTVDFINRIIPTFTPLGADAFKLPQFAETPPLAFAMKVADGEVKSHTVIPAPVIKAIGQYVVEIQKMIMQQMQRSSESLVEPEV